MNDFIKKLAYWDGEGVKKVFANIDWGAINAQMTIAKNLLKKVRPEISAMMSSVGQGYLYEYLLDESKSKNIFDLLLNLEACKKNLERFQSANKKINLKYLISRLESTAQAIISRNFSGAYTELLNAKNSGKITESQYNQFINKLNEKIKNARSTDAIAQETPVAPTVQQEPEAQEAETEAQEAETEAQEAETAEPSDVDLPSNTITIPSKNGNVQCSTINPNDPKTYEIRSMDPNKPTRSLMMVNVDNKKMPLLQFLYAEDVNFLNKFVSEHQGSLQETAEILFKFYQKWKKAYDSKVINFPKNYWLDKQRTGLNSFMYDLRILPKYKDEYAQLWAKHRKETDWKNPKKWQ